MTIYRTIALLVSLFLVGDNAVADNATCQQRHCIAVVDAGSTGSRLHLYAFDLDDHNHPIKIDDLWSKKIKPGFAAIEPNQETINDYLSHLFADAPEQGMPVYFYATAGMRLETPSKQQLYYQALQQWFAQQSQWRLIESRTITGNEEGVLSWLAVNYQLGIFDETNKPLVSVMDMGGASVQIAFSVKNIENIDPHDLVSVDAVGRHFTLFVHSFLGLGKEVLSQQFLDTDSCFALGYSLPSGLLGNGNASSCQRDISKLINNVHKVSRIVQPVIAKNTVNTWYAIGGVASMVAEIPFSFEKQQFTNQDMLQKADSDFCHQQWDRLSVQYPNYNYLYGYCLFPSYYYALMVDGYGIKPEQPINYLSSNQSADWSLGVVLHHH